MKRHIVAPFQEETKVIKAIRVRNARNLIDEVKLPAYKAFLAIQEYYADLIDSPNGKWRRHQPANARINDIRNTNILDISPELLVEYGGACECATTKNTNSNARRLMKQLQQANVVYKISKDRYMINPFYIYIGKKIDDAVHQWCEFTGDVYDEQLMNGTRKRYDSFQRHKSDDLTREEQKIAKDLDVPLATDIMDDINAIPHKTFDQQQPIKQQEKLTGFLDYLFNKNHPDANHFNQHRSSYMTTYKPQIIEEINTRWSNVQYNYQIDYLKQLLDEVDPQPLAF